MATNFYVGLQLHQDAMSEVTVQTGNQTGSITSSRMLATQIPAYVVKQLEKLPGAKLHLLFCQTEAEYLRPLVVAMRGRATLSDLLLMPKRIIYSQSGFTVRTQAALDVARTISFPVALGGWRSLTGVTADLLTEWWELPSAEFNAVCPLMRAIRCLSPAIDASFLQQFMREVIDPRWYATLSDVCGVTDIKRFYGLSSPGEHAFPPSLASGDALAQAYERAVPQHGRHIDVFLKSQPDLLDRKVRVQMLSKLLEYLACAWLTADSSRKSEFLNPKEILSEDEYVTFTANSRAI